MIVVTSITGMKEIELDPPAKRVRESGRREGEGNDMNFKIHVTYIIGF